MLELLTSITSIFVKAAQQSLQKKFFPDFIREKQGFVQAIAGHPISVVAYHKLPESLPDPWGEMVTYDSVVVGYVGNDGYVDVNGNSKDYHEFKEELVDFYHCSLQEYDSAIELLNQYFYLDQDDVQGLGIAGIYVCDLRNDSPQEGWNSWVKEIKKEEKERGLRKEREQLLSLLDTVKSCIPVEEYLILEDKGYSSLIVNGKYQFPYFLDNSDIIRAFEFYQKNLRGYEKGREYEDRILRGEYPVARLFGHEIYIKKDRIEVPKNLAGLIIGKSGSKIKELSEIVGKRLQVKTTAPVEKQGKGIYFNLKDNNKKPVLWERWKI